jgi:hypothetical protein
MKNLLSLIVLAVFLLIYAASSTTKNYYQVFETQSENSELVDNLIKFEDANCSVTYNLWEEGGNIGFNFYNKKNELITINKEKCFFILNGVAYDYFLNRLTSSSYNFTNSRSGTYYYKYSKSSYGNSQTVGNSTTLQELDKIGVPPNSIKNINEYRVNSKLIRNCDMPRFPGRNQTSRIDYDKGNSPFIFSNYINYTYQGKEHVIETAFYVSSISNLPEEKVVKEVDIEDCGVKTYKTEEVFTINKPSMFYIKYTKGSFDQKY